MKKILVADDNENDVERLIETLKKSYSVEYVPNGKEAIDRIMKGGLDGAVLDWDMKPYDVPGLTDLNQYNGDNIAKKVLPSFPNLTIVLRSSVADMLKKDLEPLGIFCIDKHVCNKETDYKDIGNELIMKYLQENIK